MSKRATWLRLSLKICPLVLIYAMRSIPGSCAFMRYSSCYLTQNYEPVLLAKNSLQRRSQLLQLPAALHLFKHRHA